MDHYTVVDRLLDVAVLLIFVAPFGLVATFFSWLELGRWIGMLTWSGSMSLGALVLGLVCARIGDNRDRRARGDD